MKTLSKSLLSIFIILLFSSNSFADASASLETIANECNKLQNKDEVCNMLIDFKNIGLDAVEAIKDRVKLTPNEYMILTTVNMIVNRRIRYKSKFFMSDSINQIIDLRPESVVVSLEKDF